MLSNIRNFSKTIFAKILLAIIIIPFVFWGMGGIFNSGNSNNIVKINNLNISTQDFIDHLNNSNLNQDFIRENIDRGIIEEQLSQVISKTLINMEIKKLNISMSENSLVKRITQNKNFLENGKFSRLKYEKFLLSQNLTATNFESKLKENELRKKLFSYISGGIKSPKFIIEKVYKNQNNKLEIEYINLKSQYKKKEQFTNQEIQEFIKNNENSLKEQYIDFSYVKLTPKNLTGNDDFDNLFFKKIDEIENKVSNKYSFEDIIKDLKILPVIKKNYIKASDEEILHAKIYDKRSESKIQLIEENEFFVLYAIDNINEIIPDSDNKIFKEKILSKMFKNSKFEYNRKLITKINNKEFKQKDFDRISANSINKIILDSINDDKKFTNESIKILYAIPKDSFSLIADQNNDIYLAKTLKIYEQSINKNSSDYTNYQKQADISMRDNVYSSYDVFLNDKYEVIINKQTLDRVKNFFK
jgi:peptidyl-prolyl cis-trans isomerase D